MPRRLSDTRVRRLHLRRAVRAIREARRGETGGGHAKQSRRRRRRRRRCTCTAGYAHLADSSLLAADGADNTTAAAKAWEKSLAIAPSADAHTSESGIGLGRASHCLCACAWLALLLLLWPLLLLLLLLPTESRRIHSPPGISSTFHSRSLTPHPKTSLRHTSRPSPLKRLWRLNT